MRLFVISSLERMFFSKNIDDEKSYYVKIWWRQKFAKITLLKQGVIRANFFLHPNIYVFPFRKWNHLVQKKDTSFSLFVIYPKYDLLNLKFYYFRYTYQFFEKFYFYFFFCLLTIVHGHPSNSFILLHCKRMGIKRCFTIDFSLLECKSIERLVKVE